MYYQDLHHIFTLKG